LKKYEIAPATGEAIAWRPVKSIGNRAIRQENVATAP